MNEDEQIEESVKEKQLEHHDCKGCFSHRTYDCILKVYEKECPCKLCLVKMICDNVCSSVLSICNMLSRRLQRQRDKEINE